MTVKLSFFFFHTQLTRLIFITVSNFHELSVRLINPLKTSPEYTCVLWLGCMGIYAVVANSVRLQRVKCVSGKLSMKKIIEIYSLHTPVAKAPKMILKNKVILQIEYETEKITWILQINKISFSHNTASSYYYYYYYYYYFIRQRISNIDDKCQQKILQPLERRGQKKLT